MPRHRVAKTKKTLLYGMAQSTAILVVLGVIVVGLAAAAIIRWNRPAQDTTNSTNTPSLTTEVDAALRCNTDADCVLDLCAGCLETNHFNDPDRVRLQCKVYSEETSTCACKEQRCQTVTQVSAAPASP